MANAVRKLQQSHPHSLKSRFQFKNPASIMFYGANAIAAQQAAVAAAVAATSNNVSSSSNTINRTNINISNRNGSSIINNIGNKNNINNINNINNSNNNNTIINNSNHNNRNNNITSQTNGNTTTMSQQASLQRERILQSGLKQHILSITNSSKLQVCLFFVFYLFLGYFFCLFLHCL